MERKSDIGLDNYQGNAQWMVDVTLKIIEE
jgi:hypothetical protein